MTMRILSAKNGYAVTAPVRANPVVDFLLREWKWILTLLVVGGFVVLPATRTDLETVKQSVVNLENSTGDLPKAFARLDESVRALDKRATGIEDRLNEQRIALARIEGALAIIASNQTGKQTAWRAEATQAPSVPH